MSTAIHVIPEPLPTTSETRYAAYLLAEYLERLGVEVVFGLTGHTVIGLLDALGRSRIRYVSTRHEQVAAHAADPHWEIKVLLRASDTLDRCGDHDDAITMQTRAMTLMVRHPDAAGSIADGQSSATARLM